MRYVIYGAGAVGGVIGGKLFEAGHEVVLIARGAHYGAVAEHGLRLETPDAAVTLPVPVVPDPASVGFRESDVVILAVKSQDTPAALQALAGTVPPLAAVVCAQNGVANEPAVLRLFPNVYGMCVMLGATHLTPGVVQARSAPVSGLLDVGRWPAGSDHVARRIAADLSAATFSSEVRDDIPRWKWGKLLRNLANAVDALCGPQARTGEIAVRAREEGVACLLALAHGPLDVGRRAVKSRVRALGQQRPGDDWPAGRSSTRAPQTTPSASASSSRAGVWSRIRTPSRCRRVRWRRMYSGPWRSSRIWRP
jgi:2-dehydropantoate 2-reductase